MKNPIKRETKETQITVELTIDGTGAYDVDVPMNLLRHMLDNFSKHGGFDLNIKAKGDTEIDQHHTVEDIGITLGKAFRDKLEKGIQRTGFFAFPMDCRNSIS